MSDQENTFEISLADLQAAVARRDPSFVHRLSAFLEQGDPPIPEDAPPDTVNVHNLRHQILHSYQLKRLSPGTERMHYRQQQWENFTKQKVPMPPRLELDRLLWSLYEDQSEWSRQILLELFDTIPLRWGPWRAMKQIFKAAEIKYDFEMLGAIAVRCDMAASDPQIGSRGHDVTVLTLGYLRRRAWRYLRRLAVSVPALYPHAAVNFLRWYPQLDDWNAESIWRKVWISNHIFFHDHKKKGTDRHYGHNGFNYGGYANKMPTSLSKYRAFPELWNESPSPLFDLLLLCRSDRVANFAVELLREQFASELRQIPLPLLILMGQRSVGTIQLFVKNLIEDNPAFQKANFREFGLHNLIVERFLYSNNAEVRSYAISYARDYAQDLSLEVLINLYNTEHEDLHKFASQILAKREPREEIGLEYLQKLLLIDSAFELAKKKLEEGFRPSELSPEWFKPLLFSESWELVNYAIEFLEKKYPAKQLEHVWFQQLLEYSGMETSYYSYLVKDYVFQNLRKRAKELSKTWIMEALLHTEYSYILWEWIDKQEIIPEQLDLDWLRAVMDPVTWSRLPWVIEQNQRKERWIEDLAYPAHLKSWALNYIGNPKNFKPQQLGVSWLFELLRQNDHENQAFARTYLLEYFNPADFATPEILAAQSEQKAAGESAAEAETASTQVGSGFEGKSFLFTGKLRSLTRSEAQAKVEKIGGVTAKSVTKSLDYLVIGDEGSPLYAEGKKGSKQLKAEELQKSGSELQIISETDWLRMISEGSAARAGVDMSAVSAGFEYLYRLVNEDESENVRQFAANYLQARHPVLGPQQTGRPLEGEQVMPRDLYSAQRFLPLLADERVEHQKLGVAIARSELRRWSVTAVQIFALCDAPQRIVRDFALEALLGPKEGEAAEPFHFRAEELESDLVFALCESRLRQVRNVGIVLLRRHYDLLEGDRQILRLAESSDRDIRVQAVQILWMRYRRPSISAKWQPQRDRRASIAPHAAVASLSDPSLLLQFARIVLFGLPPGRLEKLPSKAERPWSSIKAKTQMIALLRDLALEDQAFAAQLSPILDQFLYSHHKMEALASLTALTQIEHCWK